MATKRNSPSANKLRGWRRIKKNLPEWIRKIQRLIGKHSTAPKTRGKYKGHGSTDVQEWAKDLVDLVHRNRPKGINYDENMQYAASMGLLLVNWYIHVHTAKSLDPNRPLWARKKAHRTVNEYRGALLESISDLRIMEKSFPQDYDLSWKRGGKFA